MFELSALEKVLFLLLAAFTITWAGLNITRVVQAVRRGRPDPDDRTSHLLSRIGHALWLTISQEKVFRDRPVISALHTLIFLGFTYYLLVNAVDVVEAFVGLEVRSDTWYGALYNLSADLLTLAVLVGVAGLWLRRFFTSLGARTFTFNARTLLHEAVRGGKISTDSGIVSGFITFHVFMRLLGMGFRLADHGLDPFQPTASFIAVLIGMTAPDAGVIEAGRHVGFWGAVGSILLFLPYFARTKHIHIAATPVNYLFERKERSGVLPALDLESEQLGAARLEDLSWPRLLDAYACIQCNRCQDACPGSQTGKSLSPAALEINKRMELNDLATPGGFPGHGRPLRLRPSAYVAGGESPRPLLEFAIDEEAVWACTTCGACMEVCPVGNEQMLDIVEIRRERVLLAGEFPRQLQQAFTGMERQGNPWNISSDKRLEWAEGLNVPTVEEKPHPDVLYWVGCAASYDPGAQKTARAFVQLLSAAGIDYAVLGKRESCTGDSARRAGNEYLYAELADKNITTLNDVAPKLIVTTCPHCMNTLQNEYPQRGGHYRVVHHTTYLEELIRAHRLDAIPASSGSVTFHDPCYLGRHNGIYDAPRELIAATGLEFLEMERAREKSFCCGAGGAQFWKEEEPGEDRVPDNRAREAKRTAGEGGTVAVACPFCKSMLASSPEAQDGALQVRDVAEVMLDNLEQSRRTVGSTRRDGSFEQAFSAD